MSNIVAVHQMRSDFDPERNFLAMEQGIKKAAGKGASCYFAPEMSLMLDSKRTRAITHVLSEADNFYVARLCALASEESIWLHIGSIALLSDDEDGRWVNRTLLIDDKGQVAARYDKMHLFDVDLSTGESWLESKIYAAGQRAVLANTPVGNMGLTICYDLRFPELFAALSRAGAEIFAIPAAFTQPTGKAHWHSLVRTRAIESQAFVVAAAQCGKHADGRVTYGHSLVVDPWGEVLLDMGEEEGLGFTTIDRAQLSEVRRQIPALINRRDVGPVVHY